MWIILLLTLNLLTISISTCPSQLSFDGHCYAFSQNPFDWFRAEDYCIAQGGHATSITNAFERSFIQQTLASINLASDFIWTGGRNLGNLHAYHWSDGSPFSYHPWSEGYPTNDPADECLAIDRNTALLKNIPCATGIYVLCKFNNVTQKF